MEIDCINLGEAVLVKLASLHALDENIRIIVNDDGGDGYDEPLGERLGIRPAAELVGLRADLDDWPTIGVMLGALVTHGTAALFAVGYGGDRASVSFWRRGWSEPWTQTAEDSLGRSLALALLALPEAAK